MQRVDLRVANKRTLESIVLSGGFDLFELKRYQYFSKEDNGQTYIERMIRFGNRIQDSRNSNQFDMFGDIQESTIQAPVPSTTKEWTAMELLSKEKEVVGIYLSGHPLDDYKLEISNFSNGNISMLENMNKIKGKKLNFCGVVTSVEHKETKTGKPFGVLHFEDYSSSFTFYLFGQDYITFKAYLTAGWLLFISGKVQKKFYNEELEFKISSIELLSDLIDKEVREVILRIDLQDINNDFVDDLSEIIYNNEGKHSLVVNVVDNLNKYEVNLLSRKNKLNLNKKFIEKIQLLKQVKVLVK